MPAGLDAEFLDRQKQPGRQYRNGYGTEQRDVGNGQVRQTLALQPGKERAGERTDHREMRREKQEVKRTTE